MRRLVPLLLAVVGTALFVGACRQYLPTNRYLTLRPSPNRQSTADARGKFNHAQHEPTLQEAEITCVDCHRFDVEIEASSPELARHLSAHAQRPGGDACHYCHRNSDTAMATAPKACDTCHSNLEPLRPRDHDVAWAKVHASASRANPAECHTCHSQAFCIDCHQRRDTIQTRVHERNFRFFHSIEARANPMKCGSCHRQDFCTRCHEIADVPDKLG